MQKVTSSDIKKALAEKHAKDFFITECKNGSTYFPPAQGLLIFDGIAIRRSYTRPCITIYEVKVSRGDFLQDPKWKLYMQYCNEIYFAVPKGMVLKEEIPDDVGLVYFNPDTGKLQTKQKAKYRTIDDPTDVYKYIIYSRFDKDRIPFYEEKAEFAKAYLEDKANKRHIGTLLGSKLAKDLEEANRQIEGIHTNEEDHAFVEKVYELMNKHGLMSKHELIWSVRLRTDEMLVRLDKAMQSRCPQEVAMAKIHIKNAMEYIEKAEKRGIEKNEVSVEISGE